MMPRSSENRHVGETTGALRGLVPVRAGAGGPTLPEWFAGVYRAGICRLRFGVQAAPDVGGTIESAGLLAGLPGCWGVRPGVAAGAGAVSYTHLTLPTKRIV